MANKQRGEEVLVLLGKDYTMRPTFEALCEIEDRLDISIANLIGKFESGNVKTKDLAVIIWAGHHGYLGNGFEDVVEPTLSDIGNALRKHGLAEAMSQGGDPSDNPIIRFMTRAIMGDKSVNEVAVENKKTEAASGNVPAETKEVKT